MRTTSQGRPASDRSASDDSVVRVVQGLVSIATDHAKCLRCHCYREVAEQAIDVARTVGVEGASVAEAVTALKRMLSQVEAGHG